MSAQPIGIDTALSRIQQIETLQQQLVAGASVPGAAGATGAGSGGAAGATASLAAGALSGATAGGATATNAISGLGATSFASLLAAAQSGSATGGPAGLASPGALTGTSTLTGGAPLAAGASAGLSAGLPAAVSTMRAAADALVGKPYIWGGGHGGWGPQPGYDCSGFVSAVLHAGGYLSTPQDTQTLPSAPGIESGPGQYVTIYDRTDAGSADHVIIDIGGQFYESGGESGSWGGGGGVARIATPPASYLSSFNLVLHPSGL